MKYFNRKDLQEMKKEFEEFAQDRGFLPIDNEEPETPVDRNLKEFNFETAIVEPMIKYFSKYNCPPFPKKLNTEYVYSKALLDYIVEKSNNPYLEYEPIDLDGMFCVAIFINRNKQL